MRRVEADGLVAVKKPTKNIRLYFLLGFPNSSVGKESTCNAGDPSSTLGLGKSTGERIGLPTPVFLAFPCGSAGKESVCNEGGLGLIPGLGRIPGEGKGYPLQYSGLENSMDLYRSQGHKESVSCISFMY